MKKLNIVFVLTILLSSTITIVKAQDRQFVWSYQSNTLPKGAKDIEAWTTYRTGREYFYNRLDTRLEFETGLSNKLQTALYFNASHQSFGASIDTLGGIADTSVSGIFSESEFSISSEWKLNIMDASTAPFGFAVYAELGLATNELEIENKLIFDKRYEKNMWALNLINEMELEYEVEKGGEVEKEWEAEPQISLSYMHMFKTNFGLGVEIISSNEIEEGEWNFSALSAGPSLKHTR